MSSFSEIADKSSTLCIGAVAVALGDPSGGTLAATGLAGLGIFGMKLCNSCAETAFATAAKTTLTSLKASPEFQHANLTRVLTLLEDQTGTQAITTQDLHSAYTHNEGPARAEALADAIHARLPFQGDDDLTKRLLKLALRSSMRACLPHVEETAIREITVQIARETDGMVKVLERVESKVDDILRSQGGIETLLQNLATQSVEDLITIARAFGETGLTTKSDLIVFLTKKGEEYLDYQAQIDSLDDRVAAIANLKGAAQDAARNLNFDEVEDLLLRVDEVETEIAAETKVARAKNALLRNRAEDAFRILSAAADSFATIDPLEPARRRNAFFQLLYFHGLRYGGPGLDFSAKMLQSALDSLTKEDAPEIWGTLQNNLAIALRNQGTRTAGPEGAQVLAEAVNAYQMALTIYTKADHPVDWAMTRNNLANALVEQGKRTDGPEGTQLLANAVTAYQNALTIRTKADHPVNWAMTQNNLAIALQEQGTRTAGPEGAGLLANAVTASNNALTIYTKADHSVNWARTQNNLAIALSEQGTRTAGPQGAQLLADAVAAYQQALTIDTKADHPIQWAETQTNLAILEEARADHDSTADPIPHLRAALTHIDAALTFFDAEHLPYHHDKATALRDDLRSRLGL